MTSILTNNGAMTALQTLRQTNNSLEATQNQISTGKEVSNAKDNAAIWSISKVMESDVEGFKAVSDSLNIGEGAVSVAREAAETTVDALKKIQEKIVAAQDGTLDRDTLQQDIDAYREIISSATGAAQFNGVNLVNDTAADLTDATGNPIDSDGDGTNDKGLSLISSLDRGTDGTVSAKQTTVEAKNLTLTGISGTDTDGTTAVTLDTLDVTTDAGVETAMSAISGMISQATEAGASFGSAQNRLEMQNEFVSKLSDTLTSGIGSMVDADMEAASAKLKALQTQQQLGVQSLSIANQAPQAISSLFR